ncbi:hypothetical protein NA56DRAFT_744141 [Hyaloscypha hepaticicola]|uniref:Uncharacterized protein n=1 Tax=Hyaloscypha hepaticicola TaxID=2082293 RepID=A0A2J6QKN1_9HELO|nr:hypothetical protein NA56DRAFT_744141 [Hyaloscypha hepaticicola]
MLASSDDHSNHSNGATSTFQKATRHYLYHLSHITGLGVCTVSDEESPLHRAMVKLTWTTRQSGARVAQSSGRWRWLSHPLVPRRWRAQCLRMFRVADADAGGRPDLGRGGGAAGCICNLQSDSQQTLALEHRNETLHLEQRPGLGASRASGFWIAMVMVMVMVMGVLYSTLEHMSKRHSTT